MGFLCVHLQIDVYTIDRINSSDVLQVVCRRLSVQSVFLAKTIFPEGMGGVQNTCGIPEGLGGGGYFCGQKIEIPGWRGVLREIPSVVGVWIFSGTTQFTIDMYM